MDKKTDISRKGKRSGPEMWNDNGTDGDAKSGLGLKRSAKAGTPKPQSDLGKKGSSKR